MLAVGEHAAQRGLADSFLITRSLEGTEPFDLFVEQTLPAFAPTRRSRIRQRLAHELGRFLARMHAAGIRHDDLHAGNLLVSLDSHDRPSFYLIDLHAVHVGQPLSWRASRANLVMFNRWFATRANRTDRLRCWRAYCSYSPLTTHHSPLTTSEMARDLEQRTEVSNIRFWRHRDKRCLANNRRYRRVKAPGVAGHAVTDLDDAALAPFLADPDEPFLRPGVKLLKDSPSSTVAELELCVHGEVRPVIYKRFRVTTWTDPWTALVRRTPALRSWVFGHGLRRRGLPTARPLAVLHRRRHGLSWEGYLLMDKIPDAVDLRSFIDNLSHRAAAERQAVLNPVIEQIATLVRELHRRGLSHRDLKATNILINTHHCYLIDLVGMNCHRQVPRSRRVQNLARLHTSFHRHPSLTRTDKLRFLRIYLQWGLFGRDGWKQWWREIEQATQAKVNMNARRGRPLG